MATISPLPTFGAPARPAVTPGAPAALAANLPAQYDARRFTVSCAPELDPLPTMEFRMRMTLRCLEWCWASQQGRDEGAESVRAVLDLHAGLGNVGRWARAHDWPPFAYHATEQSAKQCAMIRAHVPDASVCQWRCEAGGTPLLDALGAAADSFYREYPAVLFSHGPEHHADDYYAMDEAWSLVRPGGYLVVVSARNDAHRSHFRKYTLDDLAALCGDYAGFGNPIVTWPGDYWTDIMVAVPKPATEVST